MVSTKPIATMTPITCQVVNEDHQGIPGMKVRLLSSGGYHLTPPLESVTGQYGLTSAWAPSRGDGGYGYGYGDYGYGGFAGWSADPRISVTFVTERFFCIPAPWASIQASINTVSTGPASHHILLRISRDKTSYQIVHTATPLTPPAHGPMQIPGQDWNSDLCIDLSKSTASSPCSSNMDVPDTPSSLVLPSPVLDTFSEDEKLPESKQRLLKRKASSTEEEGPPRKRLCF
ncbi:hypothetical protein LZ30DRAFT_826765 [Colletotrichum cereale]|nr:hypothetical protein LZ30DRAFT_826765 [Colletotrichum cereale]